MNELQKSDDRMVAQKSANEPEGLGEESKERRRSTERNTSEEHTHRTQSRASVPQGLERVRERARQDKQERFTALLHHIDKDRLRAAYQALNRVSAPGIDGVTWQQYGEELESNLEGLLERIHRGRYRAQPSKRQYIPKADGRMRPLGIAAVEDKLAQRAVVGVLNAIYEEDFLGFSYGSRPGRGQHDALDALAYAIGHRRVNWILDVDLANFYDSLSQDWLVRFMEHRVGDDRVLRLIRKWLKAGVLEAGELQVSESGSPQGAVISPLLANTYLHYVFDLWAEQWRRRQAHGEMIIVRYVDDIVCGFEHESEAKRFMEELRVRLAQFALSLHPQKTRLIQFGRQAAASREQAGQGKPATFNFLGFTHICGRSRKGRFQLKRKTRSDRMRAKLRDLKGKLRRCMHAPVREQGRWLGRVLRGYFAYHAVPTNTACLYAFRYQVVVLWHKTLQRRSQKWRNLWSRVTQLAAEFLPLPRIQHPWPNERFRVKHSR
ncbi:MAG: group II intron reverse transcriptase/maturase [Gammaproteobacteria bacterium]|nr:group II intron reverse transcriptase/maturase [Gammaproteobacteria bacterium]